ncbi:MAG: 8-amino-7-oxononanoate synthase, partial [Acidobacteria bacterium]|nr:8-amino-7-oxononanoate synthase [Acidobacteriota bacterium]
MFLNTRLTSDLVQLRRAGLGRKLTLPNGLDFSSNDYLGLANHPLLRQLLVEALEKGLPVGSTGSRLLRGHQVQHADLEDNLSAWTGRSAHLLFGSGYDANMGVLATLIQSGDTVFSDEKNHASLIDGIRMTKAKKVIFPHNDLAFLAQAIESNPAEAKWIVAESVYSMDGDLCDVRSLMNLAEQTGSGLILDEAHATGLYGSRWAGLSQDLDSSLVPVVVIHTCGKALGCFGAIVSSSHLVRETLINRCRKFIFSTATSPILPVLIQSALHILGREPDRLTRLWDNIRYFSKGLTALSIPAQPESPIFPVVLGSNEAALAAAEAIQAQGLDVRAVRYP